jgi:Putative Ig domain
MVNDKIALAAVSAARAAGFLRAAATSVALVMLLACHHDDAPPSGLAYTSPVHAVAGTALAALSPTVIGAVTSYSVTPALPAGLSLDTVSGVVSGTPSTATAQAIYTITASNSAGSTTFALSLTVNPPAPTGLSYSSPVQLTVGVAAPTLTPTVTGIVASYAVTPALPAGLSLNTSSGEITGTPTVAVAKTSYTITATNVTGSASFALSLAVNAAVTAPPIDTAAIDTKAQTLAVQILGGGDQTLTYVQQAVLAAGFGILAQDGTLTRPDPPASQGMQFTQWDIYVMSKGILNGGYTGLTDFGAAVQQDFPEIDATEFITHLIADINTQSQSTTNAGLRLWARLIIDLGQQAEVPYDLTDPNLDPTTVDLSPLQLGLIAQRFVGDLTIMASAAPQGTSNLNIAAPGTPAIKALTFTRASGGRVRVQADTSPPCTLTDAQSTFMDGVALGGSKGFDGVISYLEEHGVNAAGTIGKVVARANIVLTYLKLLWSLVAFDAKFEMDGTQLVRTKTTHAGEQRKVTVTVKLDIGDAQIVNCLRLVGNTVGLDFSLWNTGPVANAGINWYLLAGDTSGGSNGSPAQLGYLEFALGNAPLNRTTNANGMDTITIEGRAQKKILLSPVEVDKPGKLHAKVNIKDTKIVQDLIDGAGGAIPLPAEMAYRNGLGFERSFSFPVIDWKDACDPASSGSSSTSRVGIEGARIKDTGGVCKDTWSGTASATIGSTASAQVTWVLKSVVGDKLTYQPTGTASFSYPKPDCSVTPSSQTIALDDGTLVIDYSTDPATYSVSGGTVWVATYACNGLQAGAGGEWLLDNNNPGGIAMGTLTTAAPTFQDAFSGSVTFTGGNSSWSFKHD